MKIKICLRSGQCCSGYLAFVPKYKDSDLSPMIIDEVEDFNSYFDKHAEPMGNPCKWLVRDEITTEAMCLAHTRKSEMCIDYPESLKIEPEYCTVGLSYWKRRADKNLQIPEWIKVILKIH